MPQITIAGTIIEFPDTAQSPDWSKGVIQFAEAVEDALSVVVGNFDVGFQTLNIDAFNPGTNIDIQNLSFSTVEVRSFQVIYSVFRTADGPSTTAYETGVLTAIYSPSNPIGNKWEISYEKTGDGKFSLNVTDTGQVQFSTEQIGTLNHTGTLSFKATALQSQ